MILYLDTSTPVTKLWLDDDYYIEKETHRDLARDLLGIIIENIQKAQPPKLGQAASGQNPAAGPSGLSDEPTVKDPTLHARESNLRSSESLTSVVSLTDGARRHKPDGPAAGFCAEKLLGELTALVVYKGPGSFTGLRIGLTVANTLADQLKIPIIGATGPDWRAKAKARLDNSENDRIILPIYGRPANITTPSRPTYSTQSMLK